MFRSFRYRLAVVAIAAVLGSIAYRSATQERPLPPPLVKHVTRGPQDPEDQKRVAWLRDIQARDIAEANAAMVTLDNDMLIGVTALLGALTGIFSLLSRYLIKPMIQESIKMLVSAEQFKEYRDEDLAAHVRINARIDEIHGRLNARN